MNTRAFSAYNLARGTLLNSKLTLADNGNQPLKLLDIVVSGMGMDPTAGLWLSPLHATPAVPRVFPFDLIYLDKEYRVLDTAEMGPGIDFPAFHTEISSALILPSDTLHSSQTSPGDRLIVCVSSDLEAMLASSALPSPDGVEMLIHHSVKGHPSGTESKTAKPRTIELTPERPAATTAPATVFDESVLSAVAKVAGTRNTEPKPVAAAPGPSLDVTEAVRDSSRTVQPAVVEHRIDPEDLFSNWVATAPPAFAAPRTAPPEPPEAAKPVSSTPVSTSDAPKQNGRKNKLLADTRSASIDASAPKLKAKSAPAFPEKSGSPVKSKPSAQVGANDPVPPSPPTSSSPIATTFTASSYGMWQTSMPTAIAPMSGAKSPAPLKGLAEISSSTRPRASVPQAPTTAPAEKLEPSVKRESQNLTGHPVPPSHAKIAPVTATEQIASPPKPQSRDTSNSEPHRPGDFLASLQEKLQRVQQSKPAESSEKGVEPPAASPEPAGAVSASLLSAAEAAPTTQKPTSAPPLKSHRPVQQASPPAKLRSETASGGLRSKFRQWLHPTSSPSDRRRASRRYVPGMVAHYFTGGAPKPKNVADISMSGMYLLTDDRWMPGTMIQMTLQKPCASGEKKQSINVLSRIVRRGSDGVAAEFIMPEALPHISHDIQPSQATDKFALARFL